MENFQDGGVLIRFVLRGCIRIGSISDRIRNPDQDIGATAKPLTKTLTPKPKQGYFFFWKSFAGIARNLGNFDGIFES